MRDTISGRSYVVKNDGSKCVNRGCPKIKNAKNLDIVLFRRIPTRGGLEKLSVIAS